jgi:hypothetical protein
MAAARGELRAEVRGEMCGDVRVRVGADSGGLAVALLEFFSAAAGAGIVASYFGTSAHGLRRFGLNGAGLILHLLLLPALTAFDFFGLILGLGRLEQEKIAHRFSVDAAH